eukprot:TRINITY_DN1616_c0_g1_i4.p2 TRINITY_DN1616_c0_g1~~TRINITY_DN1616_c0_g1_i4.p2  ORF type:complete len:143 (-),score=10.42 TRINITY_DN1616_c0_g1_i4:164-592(-)
MTFYYFALQRSQLILFKNRLKMSISVKTSGFYGCQLRFQSQGRSVVQRSPLLNIQAKQRVQGTVVSTKMQKTLVVAVDSYTPHPLYRKRIRTTKKYFAHDENEEGDMGDFVELVASRPISKNKKWALNKIVRKVVVEQSADL